MKRLLAAAALAIIATSASAADLSPMYSKAALKAPVYSWTGFYAGVHLGGGWSEDDPFFTMQRFTGGANTPHPLQAGSVESSFAFGGGQAGYNWQSAAWVFGLETDLSAGSNGKQTLFLTEGPINDTISVARGPEWFGTFRGRVGYLIDPMGLAYVTGGLAYGETHATNRLITGPGPVGTFALNNGGDTRAGWTVGGGYERMIDNHWSLKGEYQYIDLNNSGSTSNLIIFNGGNRAVFTGSQTGTRAHTVQVGLNYHFNSY
jgi:outer membrane immunogenic protein